MRFGDYTKQHSQFNEDSIEEAKNAFGKNIKLSRVQPGQGKTAVNDDGIKIDDSVVLSSGIVAMKLRTRDFILFEPRSGKALGKLALDDLEYLKDLL